VLSFEGLFDRVNRYLILLLVSFMIYKSKWWVVIPAKIPALTAKVVLVEQKVNKEAAYGRNIKSYRLV